MADTDAWLEKVPGIKDIVDDTEGGAIVLPRDTVLVLKGAVTITQTARGIELDFTGGGGGGGGSGNVVGPVSSTPNRIALYADASGELLSQSSFTIGELLRSNGSVQLTATWLLGNQALTGLKSLAYAGYVDNATTTIDFATGSLQKKTLSANVALTITGIAPFSDARLALIQDNPGGSRLVTSWTGVTWVGGVAPTLSTVAGSVDFLSFHHDGTTVWGSFRSAGGGGGSVTAGDGLTDTAGVFSVDAENSTITVGPGGIKRTAITGDVVIPDASETATISANAVTTAKIADANVTTAKIADSNVTTAKIADDAVTFAKLLNATAADKVIGSDAAGNFKELGLGGGVERSGTAIQLANAIPARGTENVAVDLVPSTQAAATVNTGGSVTHDVALASNKRYIVTADVQVDDGSGGWLYVKGLSVRCHNKAGTCEVMATTVIAEAFAAGVTGFAFAAAISGTNLRFTLANSNGTNRPYNIIIGKVELDKP